MSLLLIAGSSFVLGFSGACMPGPLLTVTIDETLRRGPWAGPLLVLGHGLLEVIVVLLVLAGLGDWINQPAVFSVIALAGCIMLLWMAYGMLRSLPQLRLDLSGEARAGLHPVLAGALVSLANPYFTVWWATIGLGYLVVAAEAGTIGVIVFFIFHLLSDLVWYAFISGSVSLGRNFLTVRAYRGLVGFCAVFLLGFGLYFGWLGYSRFMTGV
ncbi:MAG: LysE family translocator [Desulfuromonadales bacterium]|nr:LysE family translocator [Desulfuromonadales bacterium]